MTDTAPVRGTAGSAGAADVVERVVANLEIAVRAPRETLERGGFDLAAVGEGERIIVDLVRALLDGRNPHDVNGIAHRGGLMGPPLPGAGGGPAGVAGGVGGEATH